MASPTYLIQTQYGYYYRHKVPIDLRPLVGKTELRYSVNTGKFSLAKSRARMIAGMAQNLFAYSVLFGRLLRFCPAPHSAAKRHIVKFS